MKEAIKDWLYGVAVLSVIFMLAFGFVKAVNYGLQHSPAVALTIAALIFTSPMIYIIGHSVRKDSER